MKCPQDSLASVVAVSIIFITAAATLYVMVRPIPEQNEALVGQALGSLQTALGLVVAYFFGSTRSSSKKDDTIANLTKTPPGEL